VYVDPAPHRSDFVTASGVRLNYLDWSGSGPALILVHGLGASAHYFDDIAPALTDRFRVVAYSRRGHGRSDAKEPYDIDTLTEDLRCLMDDLGIDKAHLAGHSMGGSEITTMAVRYPERVDRIVYLDAAYDLSDRVGIDAVKSAPPAYMALPPASATTSIDAYLAFIQALWLPKVRDTARFKAWICDLVDVQPNGTVRGRMDSSVAKALWRTMFSDRRDYARIRSPALAIYATSMPELRAGDSARLAENLVWEHDYMTPFRAASIERVRRELPNVEIMIVPGNHNDFIFTSRKQVATAMRRFLRGPIPKK
jgi:pimeloyl-ACP methyl ester carboxylesterase